ncbi:hypothetical protein GCM10011414_01770 [Croceivirga lutea]|nr:hypothetical protein GCM10011414_01770 [Croceivirga lutea]
MLFSAWFQLGLAQELESFFSKSNEFFQTYVSDGKVDYEKIKMNPAQLKDLINLAKNIKVDKNKPIAYQAFWVNAYNLLVINGIVEQYPVKSPLAITGFFDATKHSIGGKEISLNDIENKVLRGNFPDEARFHFVLVCAGLGCPPIINEAYVPSKLENQLQKQTELALNNPNFIRVKGKKVLLSQIFEWYKTDFVKNGSNEIDFINKFRTEKLDPSSKVSYYPYDWTLNSIK